MCSAILGTDGLVWRHGLGMGVFETGIESCSDTRYLKMQFILGTRSQWTHTCTYKSVNLEVYCSAGYYYNVNICNSEASI